MRTSLAAALAILLCVSMALRVAADSAVATSTQSAAAVKKYGVTGKGVLVAILDRGIDYTHPDFRNANGTTRIKYMLDMSGQSLCDAANPAPVEYDAVAIDHAIQVGPPLAERDAVGHGTVTAGLAAGNGRALGSKSAKYAGLAPGADLLIVKVVSEGAPAHDGQPAELPFQGCYDAALSWVAQKATLLGKPVVALINSGVQWGPIDGTSAVSRKIDALFSGPGRVYVAASGDEGSLNNHARATYTNAAPATVSFNKATTATTFLQIWYSGGVPASVTVSLNDDGTTLTVPPGNAGSLNGVTVVQYVPGLQFYPWQSSGPDRAVWIRIVGHSGPGSIRLQTASGGTGSADLYSDVVPTVTFASHLTSGRLTDYSATRSAIVAGASVVRTAWTDIDGISRTLTTEGAIKQLWKFSSGGPTRDGRVPPMGGVDIVAPGANSFAAYARDSYWGTFRSNLIAGGGGYYGRHSATSAAAPIAVGAVALMLQVNPDLTSAEVREMLQGAAVSDSKTGATPNHNWGAGRLNVLGAVDAAVASVPTDPILSSISETFGNQPLKTTSAPRAVTLSNAGTSALTITGVTVKGNFKIQGNTCGAILHPGGSCTVNVVFKPAALGVRTGSLSFTDFHTSSPQVVALSGNGV
jgi:minor extracellular serine protease Vpr